jgi:hypothetical protein
MPLRKAPKGSSKKTRQRVASANISEMHKSSQFKKVARKFGKARANRMAVAAGLSAARGGRKRKKK